MVAFLISVFGTNLLAQWYKKIQIKYGDTEIHVVLAVLSCAAATIVSMFGQTETFKTVIGYAGSVFASAIALYEVIWKQFGSIGITDADLSS